MTTPTVTEIIHPLEPLTGDSFIADLLTETARPVSGPPHAAIAVALAACPA
jgi:hypothetical protein